MKRLLVPLLAAGALAVPAAASAHFGFGGFAKLSGTGSTFAATSATASGTAVSDTLGTGTFSLSLSTTLSAATTHTGEHGAISCAPSTGTLTLTGKTAKALVVQKGSDNSVRGFVHVRSAFFAHSQDQDNDGD